jgi:hypothetical protein
MAQRPEGVTPEEWRVWRSVQARLGSINAQRATEAMTPEQRTDRAKKAAAARWAKAS